MIQSVDSLHLAEEISKQAQNNGLNMKILLEVNIGSEESKTGFSTSEFFETLHEISEIDAIRIKGLMTIPPICENDNLAREYFRKMHKLFIDIGKQNIDNSNMDILSMGMSQDFDIAIEEGATLVRVGTAIFGNRNYNK